MCTSIVGKVDDVVEGEVVDGGGGQERVIPWDLPVEECEEKEENKKTKIKSKDRTTGREDKKNSKTRK